MAGERIPLCGACGAAAFRTSGTCTVCHTHLPETPLLAPAVAEGTVVCLQLAQACTRCNASFVVRDLADNAQVTCGACAFVQTLAFRELRAILGHVRQVAAIVPTKQQRSQQVAYELAAGRLHGAAFRGHPLCDACRSPLALAIAGDATTASCPRCATAIGYRAHPFVARAADHAVAAIVAPFAAASRRDFAIDGGEDTIALRCPGCRAPVDASDRRVIKCRYCEIVAWVPDRAWQAKSPKEPIWLVVRATA